MSYLGSLSIGGGNCKEQWSIPTSFGSPEYIQRHEICLYKKEKELEKDNEIQELLEELDYQMTQAEKRHSEEPIRIGKASLILYHLIGEWTTRYWYVFGRMFPKKFHGLLEDLSEFSRAVFLDNFTTDQIKELLRLRVIAHTSHDDGNGKEEKEENLREETRSAAQDEEKYLNFYRPAMVVARKLKTDIVDTLWKWREHPDEVKIPCELYRGDPKIIDFLRDSKQFESFNFSRADCFLVFQEDYVEFYLYHIDDSYSTESNLSDE